MVWLGLPPLPLFKKIATRHDGLPAHQLLPDGRRARQISLIRVCPEIVRGNLEPSCLNSMVGLVCPVPPNWYSLEEQGPLTSLIEVCPKIVGVKCVVSQKEDMRFQLSTVTIWCENFYGKHVESVWKPSKECIVKQLCSDC